MKLQNIILCVGLLTASFEGMLYSMVRISSINHAISAQVSKVAQYLPKYGSASVVNTTNTTQVRLSQDHLDMIADEIAFDTEQDQHVTESASYATLKPRKEYVSGLLKPTLVALASSKPSLLEPRNVADAKKILGISGEKPTKEEINTAFKKMALIYHPDKGGNSQDFRFLKTAQEILLGKPSNSATDYSNFYSQQKYQKSPIPEPHTVADAKKILRIRDDEDLSYMQIRFAACGVFFCK